MTSSMGQDSSVATATGYGLDGPEIESRWGRDYRPWGPPSLLYSGYLVYFPGIKRPGRGVNHLPPSSAEVKEKLEVHLYSPSRPSWARPGWTLPLPFNYLFHMLLQFHSSWSYHHYIWWKVTVINLNFFVFWFITQGRLVINRRFGTTYTFRLQGSSFLDCLILKDGTNR